MPEVNYLDLNLRVRERKIEHKLYDKRDAFGFTIVNFPDLSGNIPQNQSYGVVVSQLIRYARCCQFVEDFVDRTRQLVARLLKQNFGYFALVRTFMKFLSNYFWLLDKYGDVEFCDSCDQSKYVFPMIDDDDDDDDDEKKE